ncbi:hypothetical protein PAHAL_3G318500 [Panicum hallii]|uniref:Uncharacterized protein n=1 Tax=Panicum hallii TaxID=206008 RepID=A0A2T8KK38_9POAL|nr:hypothetical protein PAHAL_3G318500 [Panicum hallii]
MHLTAQNFEATSSELDLALASPHRCSGTPTFDPTRGDEDLFLGPSRTSM